MHTAETLLGELVDLELRGASILLREAGDIPRGVLYRLTGRPKPAPLREIGIRSPDHKAILDELIQSGLVTCSSGRCRTIVSEAAEKAMEVSGGIDYYVASIPADTGDECIEVCDETRLGRLLCRLVGAPKRRVEEALASVGRCALKPVEAMLLASALKSLSEGMDTALTPPPGVDLRPVVAVIASVYGDVAAVITPDDGWGVDGLDNIYTPDAAMEEILLHHAGWRLLIVSPSERLDGWGVRHVAALTRLLKASTGARVLVAGNYLYGGRRDAALITGGEPRVIGVDAALFSQSMRKIILFFIHMPWGYPEEAVRSLMESLGELRGLVYAGGMAGVNQLAADMGAGVRGGVAACTAAFIPLADPVDYKLYKWFTSSSTPVRSSAGVWEAGVCGLYREFGYTTSAQRIYELMKRLVVEYDYAALDYAGCILKLYLAASGLCIRGVDECLEAGGSGIIQVIWSMLREEVLSSRGRGLRSRGAREDPGAAPLAGVLGDEDTVHAYQG